jgi:hypothetical protein
MTWMPLGIASTGIALGGFLFKLFYINLKPLGGTQQLREAWILNYV